MRASIEFTASGATIDEVLDNAIEVWKKIGGYGDALPSDAEIAIEGTETGSLIAKVFVRMKVEK